MMVTSALLVKMGEPVSMDRMVIQVLLANPVLMALMALLVIEVSMVSMA